MLTARILVSIDFATDLGLLYIVFVFAEEHEKPKVIMYRFEQMIH